LVGGELQIFGPFMGDDFRIDADKKRDGAVILGWTGDNGDPDNFMDTLLGCDAVGGNNRAKWCNKEFDDLMTKAKLTADVAER
ncbi:ABC transporter substrate-binding protein, partial [Rhizobium ruizarguesonis]